VIKRIKLLLSDLIWRLKFWVAIKKAKRLKKKTKRKYWIFVMGNGVVVADRYQMKAYNKTRPPTKADFLWRQKNKIYEV